MTQLGYRPNSNITGSFSIKGKDEKDYLAMRSLLRRNRISIGEYLVTSYRELDQGATNDLRLEAIRREYGNKSNLQTTSS